ncbi:serine hydrolase-domain-containing protein [Mucidula mucida]|nr:serine hydrolase-domain-containing protein [Mucidula mucida]
MSSRKILMLHGYGQNAYMMSRYMSSITKDLAAEDVEFQYLDAPFSLTPADLNATHASIPSPPKSAPVCSIPNATPSASDSPRGWFTIKTLKENRFEAIMGFSQGAAMAELLVAMLERPDLYPFMADDNGAAVHPPMQYIVAVSGFLLRGPSAAWDGQPVSPAFPSSELTTPVLHVVGNTDFVVPRERADIFMSLHKNKRVEEHIGGHFVPRQTKWRNAATRLPSKREERRSGSSTPDSDGPGTPTEQELDVKEVDLQLGTSKLLVEEEEARMWDIYTGLVYQGL